MELQTIELQKIIPDPCQPRKFFDLAALEELASSIEQYGLLSPIIVRKQGDRYIIVAGERRYRAMLLNKMTHANCIVRNHIDFREVSLIENVQREDLNPLEEAEALSSLMIEKHYTQEELSKLIGKSRPYITNQLRLLRLDDETKQALLDNIRSTWSLVDFFGQFETQKKIATRHYRTSSLRSSNGKENQTVETKRKTTARCLSQGLVTTVGRKTRNESYPTRFCQKGKTEPLLLSRRRPCFLD